MRVTDPDLTTDEIAARGREFQAHRDAIEMGPGDGRRAAEAYLEQELGIAIERDFPLTHVIDHLAEGAAPIPAAEVRAIAEQRYAGAAATKQRAADEASADLGRLAAMTPAEVVRTELEGIPNPYERLTEAGRYGFNVSKEHLQAPETAWLELWEYLGTAQFRRKYEEVMAARRAAQKASATRIIVNGSTLHEMTEAGLNALKLTNAPRRLFIRAGEMVRVVTDEDGRPAIQRLDDAAVRGELDRAASWVRLIRDGEIVLPPPLDVVRDLTRLPRVDLPALRGITEVPTMRPDGTVLDSPGYDEATGLYYAPAPGLSIPRVPATPTADQVAAARDLLHEVFCDFPFVDEASKANTIACLVTAVIRPMIRAPVPMALFDKPAAGTGASLIAEIVAEVLLGRDAPMMKAPEDEGEWRKQILAILIAGRPVMVVDNIEGRFGSAALSSLLTSMVHEDRILGKSENVQMPHRTVWIGNGINVQLGGDLPRRIYLIRMDAEHARPWQRTVTFKHPDLKAWVRESRAAILFAVLMLARAWVAAGRPVPKCLPKVGGFDGWAETVGGILYHAKTWGFLGNLPELYDEADEDGPAWEIFLERWYEIWGDEPITIARMVDYIHKESGQVDLDAQLLTSVPPDIAEYWSKQGNLFASKLGYALRHRNRRPFPNGYKLVRVKKSQKAAQWSVRRDKGVSGV